MASILMDNIVKPYEEKQEGSDSISASLYDEFGNKYVYTLSLTVSPKTDDEEVVEEPVTLAEQIATILEKVTSLEDDVALLKGYHAGTPTENISEDENISENTEP